MKSPRSKCFACDRRLGRNPNVAVTCDFAQAVYVGSECYKKIGPEGWQPPMGGPRLYRIHIESLKPKIVKVVGLPEVVLPDYVVDAIIT